MTTRTAALRTLTAAALAVCALSAPALADDAPRADGEALRGALPGTLTTHDAIPDPDGLKRTAVLRGLDKVTGRVSEFIAPAGQPVRFGRLDVLVRTCDSTPPEEAPESTAYLEIIDNRLNGERVAVHQGWMFASSPALAPLQHPVYDVWVINCTITDPVT